MLAVADAHSPRASALISLLAYNGVRIEEALDVDVSDYTYQRGHRVLRIMRKGGKSATAPLNPIVVRALDAYLADNHLSTGWLFLNRDHNQKLAYSTAFEMISASPSRPACRSKTCKTLLAIPIPEPLAATTTSSQPRSAPDLCVGRSPT